jgi:hypothetical protein
MQVANDKPNFLSIYKSMDNKIKRELLIVPFVIETGLSEDSFFRKVRLNSWTLLERKWLSQKLNLDISELFPQDNQPNWINQAEMSQKVKKQVFNT